MLSNPKTLIASVAVLGAAAILPGCVNDYEYLNHRDTITLGAGDAIARNKAIHTVNPRPRHAYRTHIHFDGERMKGAMDNYHKAPNPESVENNPDSSTQNGDTEVSDPNLE